MDIINALTTPDGTKILAFIYYAGLILVAFFTSGWILNRKLKAIVKEDTQEIVTDMNGLAKRVYTLEVESVKTTQHDRDMKQVFDLVTVIREEIRQGTSSLTARIDSLFPFLHKGDN